jgi:hypothetical protein
LLTEHGNANDLIKEVVRHMNATNRTVWDNLRRSWSQAQDDAPMVRVKKMRTHADVQAGHQILGLSPPGVPCVVPKLRCGTTADSEWGSGRSQWCWGCTLSSALIRRVDTLGLLRLVYRSKFN